jgi:hypothetical protein
MESHWYDCQCSDYNHVVRFEYAPLDGTVYLTYRLNAHEPWWKRLWIAAKYVFKRDHAYGHYDVTLLRPEDFTRLHTLLDRAEAFNRLQTAAAALTLAREKPLLKG